MQSATIDEAPQAQVVSAHLGRAPRSRHNAAELASGYTRLQNAINAGALVSFCGLAVWVGMHTFSRPMDGWLLCIALLAAWVFTDFACGMIHWAGDTWGHTSIPVIGRMLVRNFREHHVDPAAITRHTTVQVLGEQAIFAVPLMALLRAYDPAEDDHTGAALLAGMYAVLVAAMCSNLFHRWAHMGKPPWIARVMQLSGLIITFKQHARHHCPPYTNNYCIAIGWLNPVLDRIRFWRSLEWLVWKTTGAIPREDDLGREAALALMRDTD